MENNFTTPEKPNHDAKVCISESTLSFLCYTIAGLSGYVIADIAYTIFKWFR